MVPSDVDLPERSGEPQGASAETGAAIVPLAAGPYPLPIENGQAAQPLSAAAVPATHRGLTDRELTDRELTDRELLVDIRDLHKTYRDTQAVRGLSLQMLAGQVVGLVGPNGAGKTTTMRTVAGIIPPTEGILTVCGFDVRREPVEVKRRLAYIPDDPKLFDMLTVEEHLEFVASAYQVPEFREKGRGLLEQFDLWEKRKATTGELSRGMRQKVAICCAYLHDPRVIMFDEPHTGLDPRGIRTMKNSIQQRAAAGSAVIVSSHLLNLVEDLCTHLLIMNHGKRLFFGPIAECRAAFEGLHGDASLEEIFFHATERPPER